MSSSLRLVAPFVGINDFSDLPGKVENVVKELNERTYGKLEFKYFDPTKDRKLEAVLKRYNIMSLTWPVLSDGKIKPGKGAIGLVMEYGDKVIGNPC
jgi:hypothetical protein